MRFKLLSLLALATALAGPARADLVATDFWTAGDRYLVQDSSTEREWLSPVATRNHSWGDALIQSLFDEGFRYATRAEVLQLIESNFGLASAGYPGDAAGFAIAADFFAVFGITEPVTCLEGGVWVACPRNQGLTADESSPGRHIAVGMVQYGSNGYLVDNSPWPDGTRDLQLGSWLVRGGEAVQALPEPGSLALLAVALGGAAWPRRRKSLGNLA